jgi:hypothetical protein
VLIRERMQLHVPVRLFFCILFQVLLSWLQNTVAYLFLRLRPVDAHAPVPTTCMCTDSCALRLHESTVD